MERGWQRGGRLVECVVGAMELETVGDRGTGTAQGEARPEASPAQLGREAWAGRGAVGQGRGEYRPGPGNQDTKEDSEQGGEGESRKEGQRGGPVLPVSGVLAPAQLLVTWGGC